MMRILTSVGPPGGNGTTIRMARLGKWDERSAGCAAAGCVPRQSVATAARRMSRKFDAGACIVYAAPEVLPDRSRAKRKSRKPDPRQVGTADQRNDSSPVARKTVTAATPAA